MDWKNIISELCAGGLSQAAIGQAIGKSQGWVSAVYLGEYSDVRWRDGEALRRLHAAQTAPPSDTSGPDPAPPETHQEAA